MLRISIALTFFGHGVKGLFHSSNFLHLMQGTEMTLFGAAILSPEMNLFILDAIGVVDLDICRSLDQSHGQRDCLLG